ncbi:MAG: hypothetical protein RL701_6529, partial [Pseudomonadota bacterium]
MAAERALPVYRMSRRNHRSYPLYFACSLLAAWPTVAPSRAFALQPLQLFLQGARKANHDNREATAAITQRLAETDVAHAKLYPTFSATGSYTLNQYEVST